jgi:hypothetical protein
MRIKTLDICISIALAQAMIDRQESASYASHRIAELIAALKAKP